MRQIKITDTDKTIGNHIKLRRIMLGMSQTELAKLCGISFQQIQKYESAKNRISCSRLFKISKVLNVPVEFFFENTDKVYKPESLELLILYFNLPQDLRKKLVIRLLTTLTNR